MKLPVTLALLLGVSSVFAQATLRSGPMLGYNTMREVAVWVQTTDSAEVSLRFWKQTEPTSKHLSASAKTVPESAFCATLVADSLDEGTAYAYEVLLDGRAVELREPGAFTTQALWEYRTDPPEITVALGSCYYANDEAYDRPGGVYGGEEKIFLAIDSLRPDLMLWLGDNIYLRPGDFDSEGAVYDRWSLSRAIPELRGLLAHSHNYAIWDDHDYGPNDADRSYIHKDWTNEAFRTFWANPATGIEGLEQGHVTAFRYGDAEFFLLDDRSFRAPNDCKTCEPMDYLGERQLDWLVEALVSSSAGFKFVLNGGQVLNDAKVYETYVHHHGVERERLLDRLGEENIRNVVFLTGDRHHTELSRLTRDSLDLYDFTVSPLTAGVNVNSEDEPNSNRVPGTWVGEHNFGTITLAGTREERTATLRVYSAAGERLWERVIAR